MSESAVRPLGRPKAGDSAETRQRLLRGAQEAFAAHGFDATTNKEIAAAAGVTTAAIYHYFSSKTELYLAALEALFDRAMTEFVIAVEGRDTLVGQFTALLDRSVALHRDDPSFTGFIVTVMAEAGRQPELYDRMRRSHRQIADQFYEALVGAAVRRGELASEMAVPVTDLMISVLAGLARFTQTGDIDRLDGAVGALKRVLDATLLEH